MGWVNRMGHPNRRREFQAPVMITIGRITGNSEVSWNRVEMSGLPTNRTTQRKPFRICGSELPLTVIGKRPCAGTAVLALVHFLDLL